MSKKTIQIKKSQLTFLGCGWLRGGCGVVLRGLGWDDGSCQEVVLCVGVPQGVAGRVHQVAFHFVQVNTSALPHFKLQHCYWSCNQVITKPLLIDFYLIQLLGGQGLRRHCLSEKVLTLRVL